MEKELNIYEIMLELAEDENDLLKIEISSLKGYIQFLQAQLRETVTKYNELIDINKRLN
jgi:hypothetical protein